MLERRLAGLEVEACEDEIEEDFGSPLVIARTMLLAAMMFPAGEWAQQIVGEEAGRLAADDLDAAERALAVLRMMRERLQHAVGEMRTARALSAAIVRASDALPEVS